MHSQIFNKAFDELIAIEGGYVNNSRDKGKETRYGISKASYPNVDIKNLSLEQAKQIYWQDYWLKVRADEIISNNIAYELFEQAVNMGTGIAIEHLQKALNFLGYPVTVDRVIGPQTLHAVNTFPYIEALLKTLNGLQFLKYITIIGNDPSQQIFFRGWLKRVTL